MIPIVFVLPSFAAGGAERVLIAFANALAADGHEVHLVAVSGEGPLRGRLAAGIAVHDLQAKRVVAALPGLVKALRSVGQARVVSTIAHLNLVVLLARSFLRRGTRVFVREANTPSAILPEQPWSYGFELGYRWLYPLADGVICPSERIAEELSGFGVRRLMRLANPVDESTLRGVVKPRRAPGVGLRLVAAGRLTRQKGFDRLIEWSRAWPAGAELNLFGDGPLADELARKLETEAVRNVHLRGFEPQLLHWIAGADALLLPSRWEGMANVALEALACGTPVIGLDSAGGLAEMAAHAPPGAVTVVKDGDGFGAAVRALIPRAPTALRPSLLPSRHRLPDALRQLVALLAV